MGIWASDKTQEVIKLQGLDVKRAIDVHYFVGECNTTFDRIYKQNTHPLTKSIVSLCIYPPSMYTNFYFNSKYSGLLFYIIEITLFFCLSVCLSIALYQWFNRRKLAEPNKTTITFFCVSHLQSNRPRLLSCDSIIYFSQDNKWNSSIISHRNYSRKSHPQTHKSAQAIWVPSLRIQLCNIHTPLYST